MTQSHATATGVYDKNTRAVGASQRELEASLLLKAAKQFQDIQSRWETYDPAELDQALLYNRKLWTVFVDAVITNTEGDKPESLQNNIANLGVFIFKRTLELQGKPEKSKLDILIEINQNVAAGLMTAPAESSKAAKDAVSALSKGDPVSGTQFAGIST